MYSHTVFGGSTVFGYSSNYNRVLDESSQLLLKVFHFQQQVIFQFIMLKHVSHFKYQIKIPQPLLTSSLNLESLPNSVAGLSNSTNLPSSITTILS